MNTDSPTPVAVPPAAPAAITPPPPAPVNPVVAVKVTPPTPPPAVPVAQKPAKTGKKGKAFAAKK